MTTALFTHADCLNHVTPPGHPEQVARLTVINNALRHVAGLDRRDCPMGDLAAVTRAHPMDYVDRVRAAVPDQGEASLDADTSLSPGSFDAAMRAVGGICAAVDAVMAGEVGNAFVACRPPGHHAERETAMGFCLFGTVAIGALHALEVHGLNRVAIIDFDVHHGNGTQDLLWDEARVLFASTHQSPLYPGSGAAHETGAQGNILNYPLRPMSSGVAMRAAYSETILPQIADFAPELILISAGFDAHTDDPLAQLEWETEDFRWLTAQICDLAAKVCGGRVVSTLEGGYDLNALAASVAAHVDVLMEYSA